MLMLVLGLGVVFSALLQAKTGPAASAATRASRLMGDGVVAEVRVAGETRAYHATEARAEKLAELMQKGIAKELEHEKQRAIWQTFEGWRRNTNFILAYFLIGRALMKGEIPFAAYHATFGLSINLAFSLGQLLQSLNQITVCSEAIKTINSLTAADTSPRTLPEECISLSEQHLVVRDLCFQVKNSSLLQGVSFKISRGQLLVVVGKSGSGKSTLLKVLSEELSHKGNKVALMRQDVPLFRDTLRENVVVHRPEISEEIVEKCLKDSAAPELLSRLDDMVADGDGLSGGERQRVGLARAICGKPEVLLLDEPSSALDPEAEKKVFEMLMLKAKEEDTTILMVTHRVAFAEQADVVLVLEDGKLVQMGHHKDLKTKKDGPYYQLLQGVRF